MYWKIQHKDHKTGAWKNTVANANVTSIKADEDNRYIEISGHRYVGDSTSGRRDHRIMLTADIIERAARKLGLIKE